MKPQATFGENVLPQEHSGECANSVFFQRLDGRGTKPGFAKTGGLVVACSPPPIGQMMHSFLTRGDWMPRTGIQRRVTQQTNGHVGFCVAFIALMNGVRVLQQLWIVSLKRDVHGTNGERRHYSIGQSSSGVSEAAHVCNANFSKASVDRNTGFRYGRLVPLVAPVFSSGLFGSLGLFMNTSYFCLRWLSVGATF